MAEPAGASGSAHDATAIVEHFSVAELEQAVIAARAREEAAYLPSLIARQETKVERMRNQLAEAEAALAGYRAELKAR